MRRFTRASWGLGTLLALLATADGAAAATGNGVVLPPTLSAFGRELVLTSCGVRELWWTDVYVVSFYLPQRTGNAAVIFDPATEKVIRMDVVYDGDIPDEMPDTWRQHLQRKLPAETFAEVAAIYRSIAPRSVVLVGYAPREGTVVSVNGRTVLTDPGSRLIEAMLDLWIGPNAESQNLRRLLLQGGC